MGGGESPAHGTTATRLKKDPVHTARLRKNPPFLPEMAGFACVGEIYQSRPECPDALHRGSLLTYFTLQGGDTGINAVGL